MKLKLILKEAVITGQLVIKHLLMVMSIMILSGVDMRIGIIKEIHVVQK